MKENKPTHGGARPGSGRKPKEPTVTKRVPLALVPAIDKLIQRHKAKKRP